MEGRSCLVICCAEGTEGDKDTADRSDNERSDISERESRDEEIASISMLLVAVSSSELADKMRAAVMSRTASHSASEEASCAGAGACAVPPAAAVVLRPVVSAASWWLGTAVRRPAKTVLGVPLGLPKRAAAAALPLGTLRADP
jgi:hypothetical protein